MDGFFGGRNMRKFWVVVLAFAICVAGLTVALYAQDWDDDEEEQGVTDEEFREFIMELIEQIIEEAVAEGPNVDLESSPAVVDTILNRLEMQRVTIHFDDTPFEEALDFLRDITGLNIVCSPIVRQAIEDEDLRVNLRLRDIKLKNALALMLEVNKEFTYGVKHDVLYIGTREDWSHAKYLFIYSIHEIVYRPPNFKAPEIGLGNLYGQDQNP